MTILTSIEASILSSHTIRQIYLLYHFVLNNSKYSSIRKLSQFTRNVLRDIVQAFEHKSKKNSVSIDWTLNHRSFNAVIRALLKEVTNYAEWLKKQRRIYEKNKSSSAEENISSIEISNTSRTFRLIRFITSKTSSRNKKSFKKLIKISFKLFKNNSKKTAKSFLKNKEKLTIQFKKNTESFIDSSKDLTFVVFF